MGIEEGTCWDEHWVLYVSNEPWESTPKTKNTLHTLYVSQFDNKLYLKKHSCDRNFETNTIKVIIL